MKFNRVFLIVLDSLGVGEASDALKYDDVGSNTLGHINEARNLFVPNLEKLGFLDTLKLSNKKDVDADDEQIRNGAGYDHCFVLNKREPGELSFAAKVVEPVSGRSMEVYTTEPGVQFYSDNWADGYKGQHGATFPRRSALCFEAQHFPDSPNRPYFPPVVLKPGQVYTQKTIYKFGVEQ